MKKTVLFTWMVLSLGSVKAHYEYTAGHADIGLGEHDKLELHLHAHTGAIVNGLALSQEAEYKPDEIVIVVPNSAVFARPAGTAWFFLGNAPGDDTWHLPQSGTDAETFASPFLGIGAEEAATGVFQNDRLYLTLIEVDGPGHFSLYKVSFGLPVVYMADSDGIFADDRVTVQAGGHGHYNMAFSQAGDYRITFEASALSVEGDRLTHQAVFHFHVIPEPATLALLLAGGWFLIRRP
jgi:surface-anchored protein